MEKLKFSPFLFFICCMLNLSAQDKIVITKADELPRRSITFEGKAADIVNDFDQLYRLTDGLIENLEADLNKYDIQDKSTLQSYYFALVSCYTFKKDLDKGLLFLEKARELEDKESTKLTTGLFLQSFAKAYQEESDIGAESFKQRFTEAYAKAWSNLPYEKIKNEVESQRGALSIFNPNLITAS